MNSVVDARRGTLQDYRCDQGGGIVLADGFEAGLQTMEVAGQSQEHPATVRRQIALWASPKMREVTDMLREAAQVDVTMLLTGETGTGKDVAARAIHYLSARRNGPFVKVNCAAVPQDLLESELFGHERGAFTGAHQQQIGKFEIANGGTLFLDEIGDLHAALQGKLLHVLQDGEFHRVGGRSLIKADVRIVAATNRSLERCVATGRFREDLYYRLNVIHIALPPLRERADEIPRLIAYFVERYSRLYQRRGFVIPADVMDRLGKGRYPGNVRELDNTIQRMVVLNDPSLMKCALLESPASADDRIPTAENGMNGLPLRQVARAAALAAERDAITRALAHTGWNRIKAAKLLSISYRALLYKIKHLNVQRREALQHETRPWPAEALTMKESG